MAWYDKNEICDAYKEASDEALIWREHYSEYERLMDNGLMEGLDENLPEVNDGSLAASLFKLAKRVIRKKMSGRPKALDRDDKWINELADLQWSNNILKNAKSMGTPRQKWKDAARKAAGYGGQPIVTLFVENGKYTGSDFIVPYAQDVKLEAGKASDLDSDIIFWDCYFTKVQWKSMIEQAEDENKEAEDEKKAWKERKAQAEAALADYEQRASMGMVEEGEQPPIAFDEEEPKAYNKWHVDDMKKILNGETSDTRPGNEQHIQNQEEGVQKKGIHCFIAFQRGVDAPFYMYHGKSKKCVREWSNPDPTGDVPVHYLYFYQDFINPYGIGIVKLAGGTQNVLDYMRQADILATQLGLRPPKKVKDPNNDVDLDSLIYAQDANWEIGSGDVERMEMSNQVYRDLPARIGMYKISLDQMLPSGDTSISAESGDSDYSKTPAGVKMQAAALSVDDEDFSENIDECYAMVAASMINTHFANMQGTDLMNLNSEETEVLQKAGIEFPVDETGQPSHELEIMWDEARATFEFELDPEADKTADEQTQLEGLQLVVEMAKDPGIQQLMMTGQPMILGSKKFDPGELIAEIIGLSTDNDKIITDIPQEELDAMQAQEEAMAAQAQGMLPQEASPEMMPEQMPPEMAEQPMEGEIVEGGEERLDPEQEEVNIQAIMQQYEVPQNVAAAMREAEILGEKQEAIMQLRDMLMEDMQGAPNA